jgi:biotin carboxylase
MQMPAIKIAKELGFETIVVDGNPDAPYTHLADRFEHIDLQDKEGILRLAETLKTEAAGLTGIMTAGTDFSASVAFAAEKLGLPGIPYETALDASDKERMRRRFEAAGVPSPQFIILSAPPASLCGIAYPVVVKPVDNMGARGCRRVDTEQELHAAVENALHFSRSSRVIVEEYMDGPEFSLDAIVYRGEITLCGLADRHIFFPPYFIEMGHTIPADITPETAAALLDVFTAGIRALGITCGAAKGDIKLTAKGPMIGEIAARLSGGYMSGWTYPYSSGAQPTRGAILVAAGQPPDGLSPTRNWTSAERAFISIPGTVHSIQAPFQSNAEPAYGGMPRPFQSEGKAESASGTASGTFLRVKAGDSVQFPENNVSKCGNVISAAPLREEAVKAAEDAVRAILIRLRAPDAATEAFLAAPLAEGKFPPDAFPVPPSVLDALQKLPETNGGKSVWRLLPFPEFTESGLQDYVGRGVEESLDAVRALTGEALPTAKAGSGAVLGRGFWQAMIRGGYQGAAYYIEGNRKFGAE